MIRPWDLYRRAWLIACLATLCLLALIGCAGEQRLPEAGSPTAVPPTPLPRGGELSIRLAEPINGLRPWQPRSRGEEQLSDLLYSGLMRLQPDLRPVPDLAERYVASVDGRVLTFTLRANLFWHDGQPLGADDVAFTLQALQSLPVTSTALLADLQRIVRIDTPTSNTLVLQLNERYAPLLSALTLPILPQHLLRGQDLQQFNFWEQPVGSGPFRLEQLLPGQSIELLPFAQYHHGAPRLDRLRFVTTPDAETTLAALQQAELLLAELDWAPAQAVAQSGSLQLNSYPENAYYYLAFNQRGGRLLADLTLRTALALACDLPAAVATATEGQGQLLGNSAAPGSWADLTAPLAADPAAAVAMLEQAGWMLPADARIRQREGIRLSLSLLVRDDDPRRLAFARVLAEDAAAVGIELQIEPLPFDTLLNRFAPPYEFDLLLGSWVNGIGDPGFADYAYYDPDDFDLFHSSQINQGPGDLRPVLNIGGFSDPAYDQAIQQARQIYEPELRAAAIAQAQARITELRPYLFLWTDRIAVVSSNRVRSLDGPIQLDTPMYLWNVERWYILE